MAGGGGRRKNKKEMKGKTSSPHHPLWKMFSYPGCNTHLMFKCTCKIWKAASSCCNSKSQNNHPRLVLHHKDIASADDRGLGPCWWLQYTFPCRGPQGHICCRQGTSEFQWSNLDLTEKECNIDDPNSFGASGSIQFTNALYSKGTLYLLSLQGTLATLDSQITILDVKRAIPSKPSKGFREYLVEFHGDLVIVFLISKRLMDIVDDVEVYRLDLPGLRWTKVENLGDHSLLVSNQGCVDIFPYEPRHTKRRQNYIYLTHVEADEWWSKHGYIKNCIYFCHGKPEEWWQFDMKDGSISLNGSVAAAK